MNYFVRTDTGAEVGPLSARQLRDAATSGVISRRDLVRPEGTVDWFRAETVRGLVFGEVAAATATQDAELPMSALDVPASDAETSLAAPLDPPLPPRNDDGLEFHLEPLALRGCNVRKLEGEVVEWVQVQGFADALRTSIPAAIVGRRGALVLTNRRLFITEATLTGSALQLAYLDRIDRVAFGTRTTLWRLLMGVSIALSGLCWWIGPSLLGMLTGGGLSLPKLEWQPGVIVLLGITVMLFARFRAISIGVASGTLVFATRSLDLDTVSRIAKAREQSLTSGSV